MNDNFDWTEKRIARVIQLWAAGLSAARIGHDIGTSKNSVISKVRRLNLPGRPSPIQRGGAPDMRPPRRVKGPTLPPVQAIALPQTRLTTAGRETGLNGRGSANRDAIEGATLAAVQEAPRLAVARIAPERECQWPEEHLGPGRGWRFCCAPAVHGRSYCAPHVARAYVPLKGVA